MRSLALLLACVAPGIASAQTEQVVVVGGDPALRAALAAALAPSGLAVASAGDAAAPSVAGALDDTRGIADARGATAAVWLVPNGTGASTLLVYDRGVDRLLIRALPYAPPLSDAQAAEAARTTRTMLRALRVTPDVDGPLPRAADATAIRARAAAALASSSAPAAAPVAASTASSRIAVGAAVGARFGVAGGVAAPAVRASVRYLGPALGVAAEVDLSPAVPTAAAGFDGDLSDDAAALVAVRRLDLGGRLSLAPAAGIAVHVVRLHGAIGGTAAPDVVRVDPAVRGEVLVSCRVGVVALGVLLSGDWLVRRQAFETDGGEVVRLASVQAAALAVIAVPL